MKPTQLQLTQPTRPVNMHRMRTRQHGILDLARFIGSIDIRQARDLGYAAPGPALIRLERRGLLKRTAPGVYRPVKVGERRAWTDGKPLA